MRTQTPEKSITQRRKNVSSLVDANGCTLECHSFADGKIRIPLGRFDYDAQEATPREEQSFSELYQNIKTKLVEIYHGFRLNLTNTSRYFPR